jgi:hypothetical protein
MKRTSRKPKWADPQQSGAALDLSSIVPGTKLHVVRQALYGGHGSGGSERESVKTVTKIAHRLGADQTGGDAKVVVFVDGKTDRAFQISRSGRMFSGTKPPVAYQIKKTEPQKNKRTSRKPRTSRNPRGRMSAAKELGVYDGIGLVRDAAPREQLGFLPPTLEGRIKKMPKGLYSYGFGKRGESIRPFKTDSMSGALTSTRIAASKSREYHWLIDNQGGYPVVVRIFDDTGRTTFRVEEYARKFEHAMVTVERKRTSRAARAA